MSMRQQPQDGGKGAAVVIIIILLAMLIWAGMKMPSQSNGSASVHATLSAGEYAIRSVRLTERAVERSMAGASATQRYFARATMRALKSTETARAARATAQAQATADMQAALAAHATATAQAVRYAVTQQAITLRGTATAQVLHAQGTALAAQAERVTLEVEQQKRMAFVWGITKWLLVILFAGIIVFILYRLATFRVIHRPNGKVLVVLGGVVYDPDRNPTPVFAKTKELTVSDDMQAATTARDQAVALAAALKDKSANAGQVAAQAMQAGASEPAPDVRIEVLPPQHVRPWLDEVEGQLALEGGNGSQN